MARKKKLSAESVTLSLFQPQVTQICYSPICVVLQKPLQCCTRLTLAHNILPIQQRALLPIAIESGSPCNPRQLVGLFMSNRWAINLEAAKRRNKTGKIVPISQEEAAFTEGSIKLPSVPSQISYWYMREKLVMGLLWQVEKHVQVFHCFIVHFHLNDPRHGKRKREREALVLGFGYFGVF